jgi:hypothetical protein
LKVTTGVMNGWSEMKGDLAKKKHKLFFFADRIIKLYENGYFAYFSVRTKELKGVISTAEFKEASLDGKDKLKIISKEKTYIFKFTNQESASDWVSTLNDFIAKARN